MADYVPDPKTGTGKAFVAYRHLNQRLSVTLPHYLKHTDALSRVIRHSTILRKRGS
jgi:hypothetical protein